MLQRTWGPVSAPIVHNYAHLGAAFDARGSMAPEMRYRTSTTAAPRQVLRRRAFATYALETHDRYALADSLVLSGRQHNAGAWPCLTKGEHAFLRAEVMKVHRAAARVRFQEVGPHISDRVVLAWLRRPTPSVLLRAA